MHIPLATALFPMSLGVGLLFSWYTRKKNKSVYHSELRAPAARKDQSERKSITYSRVTDESDESMIIRIPKGFE